MYRSTRGHEYVSDIAAVLQGIAPDGGLFADDDLKAIGIDGKACMGLSYPELAEKVMSALLPGFADVMPDIVKVYIKKFSKPEITPLVKTGDAWALELYHGPTSAFKDVALSVLPLFITAAIKKEKIDEIVSILTATSGDTGKAALEGFHDVPGTEITVFFPDGGVSEMQKLQMVTQEGENVRVFAVKGNFDDCQSGVKKAFAKASAEKLPSMEGKRLSSANSINIGRLVPQVVYYYSAYSQLMASGAVKWGDEVDFIVPTGNFGDILAGYIAKKTGLPVGRLVCAANSNNVLYDFIKTGTYDRRREFLKTASPSMDILVSSNLERLLFYASDCSSEETAGYMKRLNRDGVYTVSEKTYDNIRADFDTGYASEDECFAAIRELWEKYSYLCDTHTGVAYAVLKKYLKESGRNAPCVVLSTASPFKFPTAVLKALGEETSEDDFANAAKLSELTGCEIPANLSGLRSKALLHETVIEINEVPAYSMK